MQGVPETCTVRAMAMRGKHRDVFETRRREERRTDVRIKLLSLAVGLLQAIVATAGIVVTVLAERGLL